MCRPRLAFDLRALLTTSAFCLKQFKVLPDKKQVNLGLQRKKLLPLKSVLSLSHKISYPACRKSDLGNHISGDTIYSDKEGL